MCKRKKILLGIFLPLSFFLAFWALCIISFPVFIIDGAAYNKIKVSLTNVKRLASHKDNYARFNKDLNNIFRMQMNCVFMDYIYNYNDAFAVTPDSYFDAMGKMARETIDEYCIKAMQIDDSAFASMKKYAVKFLFPFQLRTASSAAEIFPPYVSVIKNAGGIMYDRAALNILAENIEILRSDFSYITDMQSEVILGNLRADGDNDLPAFIVKINAIVSASGGYFDRFVSQCINPCIGDINVQDQDFATFYPLRLDVYSLNGKKYHAVSIAMINDYFVSLVNNWKVNNGPAYEWLVNSEMKDPFESMDSFYDLLDYKQIRSFVDQCEITCDSVNYIDPKYINLDFISLFPSSDSENEDAETEKLLKSLKVLSACLVADTKNLMIESINNQTEIYLNNIDDYVKWYYSFGASVGRMMTKVSGFVNDDEFPEERRIIRRFNNIMNKNADVFQMIEKELDDKILFSDLVYQKMTESYDYFIADRKVESYFIQYREGISSYYNIIAGRINTLNDFYLQDFTDQDSYIVRTIKLSANLLSNANIISGAIIDFLVKKYQLIFNHDALKRQISQRLIQVQERKIALVHNPAIRRNDNIKIGSIIYVDNYYVGMSVYRHYGIYTGNNRVIHFAPYDGQKKRPENGIIHETTLDVFCGGRAIQIEKNIDAKYSEKEIIQRARSRLGERSWDLLKNNCEQFVRWCVSD